MDTDLTRNGNRNNIGMSIQSKLAWTFIILLIFGITAISSYSILFIRNFLLKEGVEEIKRDARWMASTLEQIPPDEKHTATINSIRKTARYFLALYDSTGHLITMMPDSMQHTVPKSIPGNIYRNLQQQSLYMQNHADSTQLVAWTKLSSPQAGIRYLKISQFKDTFYEPIKTIRWIIYSGMFISIALVILVSILFARYISRPILQLKDAAREIAEGDVERKIYLNRNDEFGKLADSLNEMASKLRADNEELQAINARQRRFFADITHEIKNPLHTISGSLEMLDMDDLPKNKEQKYIKNAQKQVARINHLYKDLVTLQRYDSDDYFIQEQQFNLKNITTHLKELYSEKAKEKGLNLEIDQHSCIALGDPDKIEQVLENLMVNALKYTNQGTITIGYSKSGDYVTLYVKDTGIGIAREHLDHLFDRFYRTDKARSRDKGGTGLGLSVVQSILHAHKQEINVKSKPGKGTTFSFKLPGGNKHSNRKTQKNSSPGSLH